MVGILALYCILSMVAKSDLDLAVRTTLDSTKP